MLLDRYLQIEAIALMQVLATLSPGNGLSVELLGAIDGSVVVDSRLIQLNAGLEALSECRQGYCILDDANTVGTCAPASTPYLLLEFE
jgi:hypothetical protein